MFKCENNVFIVCLFKMINSNSGPQLKIKIYSKNFSLIQQWKKNMSISKWVEVDCVSLRKKINSTFKLQGLKIVTLYLCGKVQLQIDGPYRDLEIWDFKSLIKDCLKMKMYFSFQIDWHAVYFTSDCVSLAISWVSEAILVIEYTLLFSIE